MNKVLEYIIRAKDATGSAVSSALSKVKGLASGIFKNATNILSAFTMIGNAAKSLMAKMQKAFAFETMTIQFKRLVGSMDEAKEHMAMLQKMGDTPPFSLEEFAAASRSMMVMTDGVLGFKKSLELVGDAAAATGQPIQNLAHEVGRAYAIIRDGQPITRAVMGLRNMGAITPEVAARLEEMQKSGAKNIEVWNELEAALGKFKGAMEDTEQTGDGLLGAISSQWDDAVRTFGESFMDAAKEGLGLLLETLKELNEDGTIESWAQATVSALGTVGEAAKTVGGFFAEIWNHLKEGREAWKEMEQEAADDGETFEFLREVQVNPYTRKKYYQGSNGSERVEVIEDMAEKKKYEKKKREEERLAKEDLRAAEKKAKLEAQMAESQKKQDEKDAKEKAAKEEEAARKAAEAAAKEAEEQREKEEAERMKLERKIHAERVRLQAAEVQAYEKEQADAEKRLADAQAKVRQAWGWYRDKDSLAAQLAEEKADAEARKQYEKDFEKLKFRRDWRTATNLSLDDEAVRRVALAKEEEAAAQRAVEETAENTRRAAEALEAIEAAFEEGGI